jgi:hypothetical protein
LDVGGPIQPQIGPYRGQRLLGRRLTQDDRGDVATEQPQEQEYHE